MPRVSLAREKWGVARRVLKLCGKQGISRKGRRGQILRDKGRRSEDSADEEGKGTEPRAYKHELGRSYVLVEVRGHTSQRGGAMQKLVMIYLLDLVGWIVRFLGAGSKSIS